MNYEELYKKYILLEEENKRLKEELQELKTKLVAETSESYCAETNPLSEEGGFELSESLINQNSSSKDKIDLFLSLFKG